MAQPQKPKWEDRLKDYVQVNDRIMKFWEDHPNGRIHTKILSWENNVLIMQAKVWRDINDQFPAAIGHAYEKENSTQINSTSCLENAETSVVGRCLAILGYEIKRSVASREEVENAIAQQEQLKQEEDRTNDPALKAKWTLLNGSVDGYEEFIVKVRGKGWTFANIEEYLTTKIKERAKDGESK
jgi:hypothetical protein